MQLSDALPPHEEVLAACPYRTVLATNLPPITSLNPIADRIAVTLAVLGGPKPYPLDPEVLDVAVETLRTGKVVLLISDRRDSRDYAKAEILGKAGPAKDVA